MASYQLSRRTFLATAAVGGGVALAFHWPFGEKDARANKDVPELNAWVVIRPDDTVVIRVARAEMGQGISTALPMLVAEELECDWAKVTVEYVSPAENLRRNRVFGDMSTNASRSVAASQQMLLQAGATAREMLIAAAAEHWNVPASECRAKASVINHVPSGRTTSFGAVADTAAHIEPPEKVALKDPKDWTLIGTPRRRLDVRDKVEGKPIYGIDVRVPGMLYAAIVHSPVVRGKLRAVDDSATLRMKGVRRVVRLPEAVAVVADSWWQANRACETLKVSWDEGDNGQLSSAGIAERLRDGLDTSDAHIGYRNGDAAAALQSAAARIEAEYFVPLVAHATMEPQNCTAHVANGRVEIWVPTQDAEAALTVAADTAGVPRGQVIVHGTMLGGGFGRRGPMQDFVAEAVLIAKDVGQPVQLLWSREQDMRHDFYRPAAMARMTAGLDADGMPAAWKVRLSGQSIMMSFLPELEGTEAEPFFLEGFTDTLPYDVPNYLLDYAVRNTAVPIGPLRGVYQVQNTFFRESFIDEMAHAAKLDPYAYRRKLFANKPRHLAALDAAAAKAGWSAEPTPGVFRGIAINYSANSMCAQVVELAADARGALRVHRVVTAIDPGVVVNPLTIEGQIQGGVVFALATALYSIINLKDGRVVESNFHDYPMLRMADMPRLETVIVPCSGTWGGTGEQALPPLAPALCNALFAATGRRVRALPLKSEDLRLRA